MMGMYDSIFFTCPDCGEQMEEQSKAKGWDCDLSEFDQDAVPLDIAMDIEGESIPCHGCGATFRITSNIEFDDVPMGLVREYEEDD